MIVRRVLLFVTIWACASCGLAQTTAIDDYVHAADDAFKWKVLSTKKLQDATSIIVDMTSQRWLTEQEVDRPVWQHWVNIVVPEVVRSDAALLMISGGSNGGEPAGQASDELLQLARMTGTVVAELKMVPNQALVFHGDGIRRKEDDLIGYTWDQFLKTGNPQWLARNAMVKSAVRAMDTVQEVVSKQSEVQVKRFVVAGASKRGWTTWLTGAMDDRVVAVVPIVIDVLGVNESMRHHFAAYGYWAPAVGNYVQHRIMQRLDHPRIEELYRLVDPLAYQKRLDMPKLILNAAGDQFFLPDSSRFYFDKLPGEKHLRYVANTDHSMRGSDAFETLAAFYYSIAHNVRRPEFTWSVAEGKLRVESKNTPQSVVVWTAVNPDARDFRLETLGAAYKSRPLKEIADGVYETELIEPAEGWAAQFVELTYDIGAPVPLKLTTNVHVLPDVLPYAGRDPSQEATVTLKVRSQTAGRAVELATEAAGLMKSKLKIDDVESVVEKDVLYLNWQPRDFRAEAGAVMGWLESQAGVLQLNVQLESGKVITTVPKTSSATENQR